jgi:hypothetical protein
MKVALAGIDKFSHSQILDKDDSGSNHNSLIVTLFNALAYFSVVLFCQFSILQYLCSV